MSFDKVQSGDAVVGMVTSDEQISAMKKDFGDRFEEVSVETTCSVCKKPGYALQATSMKFMVTYPDIDVTYVCVGCLEGRNKGGYISVIDQDGLDVAWEEANKFDPELKQTVINGMAEAFLAPGTVLDKDVDKNHPLVKLVLDKMIETIEGNPAPGEEVQEFKDLVLESMKAMRTAGEHVLGILAWSVAIHRVQQELVRRGYDPFGPIPDQFR